MTPYARYRERCERADVEPLFCDEYRRRGGRMTIRIRANIVEPEYLRYCRRCEKHAVEPLPYDEDLRLGGVPAAACRNCGCNLTGNLSGRCPECGTPIGEEPG